MAPRQTAGPLVIIGGAEDKTGDCVILREFVRLAGGEDARVLVMTVATQLPEEVGGEYVDLFKRLGAGEARAVHIAAREQANDARTVQALERAPGIFFTGGDQLRVTSLLGGTDVDTCLHARQREGVVLAGTSAGAAIMSPLMIMEGPSETNPQVSVVEKSPGMGFISGVVIDQHFAQRGRLNRLLTVVAEHPGYIGLGIDENTAIVATECDFDVIGEGTVTVIDARRMTYTNLHGTGQSGNLALYGIQLHIVPAGHRVDLRRHSRCSSSARTRQRRNHNHGYSLDPHDCGTERLSSPAGAPDEVRARRTRRPQQRHDTRLHGAAARAAS